METSPRRILSRSPPPPVVLPYRDPAYPQIQTHGSFYNLFVALDSLPQLTLQSSGLQLTFLLPAPTINTFGICLHSSQVRQTQRVSCSLPGPDSQNVDRKHKWLSLGTPGGVCGILSVAFQGMAGLGSSPPTQRITLFWVRHSHSRPGLQGATEARTRIMPEQTGP